MKKSIVFLLLFFPLLAYADIFDRINGNKENSATGEGVISDFQYRSAAYYNPSPWSGASAAAVVSLAGKGGMGCNGFDLASSFKDAFSKQALQNYAENLGGAAISAAPMLLLSYVSPSIYDFVKSAQSAANALLSLRYANCHQIEQTANSWIRKTQAAGTERCIGQAQANGMSIDAAMRQCEKSDPFEFLQDVKWFNAKDNGGVDFSGQTGDNLGFSAEEKEMAGLLLPTIKFSKGTLEYKPAEKTVEQRYNETFEGYAKQLVALTDKYVQEQQPLTKEEIAEFDIPGSPFNRQTLQYLVDSYKNPAELNAFIAWRASKVALTRLYENVYNKYKELQSVLEKPDAIASEKEMVRIQLDKLKDDIGWLERKMSLVHSANADIALALERGVVERLNTYKEKDSLEDEKNKNTQDARADILFLPPK